MSARTSDIPHRERFRRRSALIARPPGLVPLAVVLVAALLMLAEAVLPRGRSHTLRLDVDSPEAPLLLNGFYDAEHDGRGSFRWSSGASLITFRQIGHSAMTAFSLQIGPAPPELIGTDFTLGLNGQPYVTIPVDGRPRQYHVLLPQRSLRGGDLTVSLQSAMIRVPDKRLIGLRVERAALDAPGSPIVWPAFAQAGVQLLVLALCALLVRRLGGTAVLAVGLVLVVALGMLIGYVRQPLLIFPYLVRLGVALTVLSALTYWLLPLAQRYLAWIAPPPLMRTLWGVTLGACMIRLVGALYPPFDAYDLLLNVDRLIKTLSGQLVVTNRSIEFRNGITVYPPGPYLAFLPALLPGLTPKLAVQASIAFVDGCGALAVAALARALGASTRTALFSALLYAAVPVSLTALWWGLTAQVFGQALMAPLALLLLRAWQGAGSGYWVAAGVLLSVALLSHIGVAILAVAWLGMAWLALTLRQRLRRTDWWRLTLTLAVSCLVGLLFAYAPVALLKLEQTRTVGEKVLAGGYVPAYNLIWRGFLIAFHRAGFALLLPGLVLVWRRQLAPGGAELIGSWMGAVALFWVIEMVSGLQVRYIYFLTPLACIAVGLLLDALARRGVAARRVAWGVLALLLVQGSAYWWTGTFEHVALSMVSLLR